MKENQKARMYAKKKGVKHWEIAACLGISEQTILRWLRTQLPSWKESLIMEAIDLIAKEGSKNVQCADNS